MDLSTQFRRMGESIDRSAKIQKTLSRQQHERLMAEINKRTRRGAIAMLVAITLSAGSFLLVNGYI